MFRVVDDNDADNAWQKLAEFFLPRGPAVQQTGRNGQTSEVLHAAFSILNPLSSILAIAFAVTGLRVSTAKISCFAPSRRASFASRSSSEWKLMATTRPPERVPALVFAKGNYFGYSGRPVFSRLIYPTPVDGGLGVHVTFDLAGRMDAAMMMALLFQ